MIQHLLFSVVWLQSDRALSFVTLNSYLKNPPPRLGFLTNNTLLNYILLFLLLGFLVYGILRITGLKHELREMKRAKHAAEECVVSCAVAEAAAEVPSEVETRIETLSDETSSDETSNVETLNGEILAEAAPAGATTVVEASSDSIGPFESVTSLNSDGTWVPMAQILKEELEARPGRYWGTSRDEDFSRHVRMMIEENILNPEFRIDDLSEAVCMSRTTFYRKVKTLFGVSPKDLVLQIRMKYALELMKNRDLTLAEVSFKAGFASPQYFNRVFKEQQHCTPKEYRQRAMGA
jgi:AraC-like DNA-binding protein